MDKIFSTEGFGKEDNNRCVGFATQLKVEPETKPWVQDIFMASVDDLKGFHEAIRLVFPQAEAQL